MYEWYSYNIIAGHLPLYLLRSEDDDDDDAAAVAVATMSVEYHVATVTILTCTFVKCKSFVHHCTQRLLTMLNHKSGSPLLLFVRYLFQVLPPQQDMSCCIMFLTS